MTELVPRDENTFALVRELEISGILTATGLDLSKRPDLGYSELESLAAFFGYVQEVSRWALYDTMLTIERRHGDDFVAQAALVTGRQEQTINNGMSIARRIPPSRRRDGVTFSTHAEVAAESPNDQRHWLKVASDERLTKIELRSRVQAKKEGHANVLTPEPKVCPTCHREL